jgi:Asp-tRNA(Asn)/Glu-tRNA(Gln) amidotransferase A subunit family amidase
MPSVVRYLKEVGAPVEFDDIYKNLGANVAFFWSDTVVPGSPHSISDETYHRSMKIDRPALQRRYADAFRANGVDALLCPTTPLTAPPIGTGAEITIGGRVVPSLNIARNAFPSSCAGLPGVSLPMGLSPEGLPIGLELDGEPGEDGKLLNLARHVQAIIGSIAAPRAT